MNKYFLTFSILFLLFYAVTSQAAQDWYSIGLSDRAVNCILADDSSMILVGTDSGVSVRRNSVWYHIKMLPVKAMERVSSTAVAAAAGNGSNSDGIYIGKAIYGAPFYSFTLGQFCSSPTALTTQAIVTAVAGPTALLYAANRNSVFSGFVAFDTLSTLKPLKISDYAFGVEQPYCAALYLFGGRLYAGGYDRSPMAGSSYLEYMYGDSMYPMRKMKTTAIADGRFSSILGSGSLVMAVADKDSGLFFYDQSLGNPWHRINGPTSNPIRSLHVWQVSGSPNDNLLFAANKDGVYGTGAHTFSVASTNYWSEIGNLPVEPVIIARFGNNGEILAGTVKGLYRFGEQGTGVLKVCRATAGKTVSGKKRLTLAASGKQGSGKIGFDLRGRSVVHSSAGELLINNDVKPGH